MKTLIYFIISSLAILITAYLLPGVEISGFITAFVLAVVLGLINVFIRPLLVLLTLPLSVITFGLFVLVINAFLILLAGAIVPGFAIASFWWAFLFGIVLALVNFILQAFE